MSRPVLAAALLSCAVAAQGPALVARLSAPNGQPGVAAQGVVRGRPSIVLPALGDLVPLRSSGQQTAGEELRSGTSDERGLIRFTRTAASGVPGAASGMVWTEGGLGALVVDLRAGRAQHLVLQPMAELTTARGDAPLIVFARAHVAGGWIALPPPVPGTSVRLPAGDYELWVRSGDGWLWERRLLESGRRTVLSFDGPMRRLVIGAGTDFVHPAGRPDVRFGGAGGTFALHGQAASAPLLAVRNTLVIGPAVLATSASDDPVSWPPIEDVLTQQVDVEVPRPHGATRMYSLLRSAAGTWRVLGVGEQPRSPAASQQLRPWFVLPQPPDGDTWLLFVAEGHAPQARPWRRAERQDPFPLERGVPLDVVCRDEHGLPLVDVAVTYVPDGMEPATVAAHSDGFGKVHLGPVLAPGRLRIDDERFANQSLELTTIPAEPLPVTITAGETLHGIARWPDGTPAVGVVVTLRDPSNALRPAERAVVSAADGAFVFAGLGSNRGLVLFASTQRDGRTWSGKLDRLLPGGGTIDLVVRDEDPQLLPR